jgi:enoyl-CoA hydratase
MKLSTLTYTTTTDVSTITFLEDRSTMQMVKELTKVCNHLEDENPCKAVVFRGSNGHFNRGINFSEFRPDSPMDIHGFNKWEKMCVRIERLNKITICALEGDVIGGGFQIALCTDMRIAHPDTHFSLPEVKLGFLPGMSVFRLAKYIGLGHAKRIILQSSALSSHLAFELGIVDVISDNLDTAVNDAIDKFRPINPVTIQLARRLLNESFHDSFEDAIGHFLAAQQRSISQNAFNKTLKKSQP